MPALKCYIGQINNSFGERELIYTFRFQTLKDPEKYINKLARNFWDTNSKKVHGLEDTFSSRDGELYTSSNGHHEISQAAFDELQNITWVGTP
jgi:hypothetical protein